MNFITFIIIVTSFVVFQNTQLCGAIRNGLDVENSAEFPSVVGISQHHNNNKSSSIFCTGVIINHYWIATAAHCFDKPLHYPFVIAGQFDRLSNEDNGVLNYVVSYEIHPQYTKIGRDEAPIFDIAVVRLKDPLNFTEKIKPAIFENDIDISSDNLAITGWGSTAEYEENTKYPDVLQKLVLKTVSHGICTRRYDMGTSPDIGLSILCASNIQSNASPCKGDSGAGAFFVDNADKYLRGILSFNFECTPESPIVLTPMTKDIIKWVETKTGQIYFQKRRNHADINAMSSNILVILMAVHLCLSQL